MHLLVAAAVVTPMSLALAPEDDEPAEDEPLDPRALPVAAYRRPPAAVWIGATPPTITKPWADNFQGAALGMEANVRVVMPVAWLQPELRVSYDQAFELWNRIPFGPDAQVVVTVGPRFGLDHGVYGGASGGLLWLADRHIDGESTGFFGAATVYGGYLFRSGEHMRWGPELSLGTRNTLALRLEWGV